MNQIGIRGLVASMGLLVCAACNDVEAAGAGAGAPAAAGNVATGGTTFLTGSGGKPQTATGSTTSAGGHQPNAGGNGSGGNSSTTSLGGAGPSVGGTLAAGGVAGAPPFDLRCQSDADCCAVSDPCWTTMTIVAKPDKARVEADIAAQVRTACTACMAPSVQVICVAGQCRGYSVGNGTWPPAGLSATHCGVLPVGIGGSSNGAVGFYANAPAAAPLLPLMGGSPSTGGRSGVAGAGAAGLPAGLGTHFGCR